MNQLMRQQQQPMRLPSRMKSTSTQQVVHAMIQCTDGERLHNTLRSMGIESTAISSTLVTAHVPMNRVWEVTRLEEVVKIDAPRRFKRFNHTPAWPREWTRRKAAPDWTHPTTVQGWSSA
ncbi:hypothetical protein HMPREF6485_0837 [Segatella buccae ATCC 33574]|uniref:Uncharacterized protein n=2 Tax=Segatella buccae TaxID=28126 RepID=E6K5J7_9BACT|nr:hypothetical protein HMPREF6485_0837 [Segatella buccae ATCC 33574]